MTDPIPLLLGRIAAALERQVPPLPDEADLGAHPAYLWQEGRLVTARMFKPLALSMLLGLDRQKSALLVNVERLAKGHAAHDVLLWGARGTGKSALVKGCVASVQERGGNLAIVQVLSMKVLNDLFERLSQVPRAFILFFDDLGVDAPDEARELRSVLEGGSAVRPSNVRVVATANRRHLQPRDIAEQESAINPRDAVDDHLALADRFGLSLGFHAIDQEGYLAIVRSYTGHNGLPFEAEDALRWATTRGSRSGRVAWQYVVDLAGRHGRALG